MATAALRRRCPAPFCGAGHSSGTWCPVQNFGNTVLDLWSVPQPGGQARWTEGRSQPREGGSGGPGA